ncbi:MAG: O-antigen ligase family protein, partial [Pseudomonadota bacterium]
YFTFSRGAWIALGIGVLAAIAADPRRLRLVTAVLAVALWAVLGVAVAYQSDALARVGTSLEAAATDGRRVALALVALAVVAAGASVVFTRGARRLDVAPGVRRWYGVGLATLATLSVVLVFVRFGSPPTLVRHAYDAFTTRPEPIRDGNLRTRLFSLSGSGRDEQWRIAWAEAKANPWLGSGAGTYERAWVRDRPVAGVVHDAHSLYLETLAELGPIGLALLLTALGLPVVAAVAARSHPLVPATLGAYVAYLAHAAVDWDWELPAVTLAALGCAVAVLAAARDVDAASWSRRGRGVAIAATVGCALAAVVGLAANNALAAGRDALDAGSWSTARDRAATARRWAPWSAEPWEVLGKAQFGSGDRAAARASFEKAIAKDPNDWNLWFYLALASEGRARERAVAQARRLNPLSPEIASLGEERADAGS